jgi:hypothetical protein
MKLMQSIRVALFVAALATTLVGCASQPTPVDGAPGFWVGLLHGAIAPLAFIGSLFSSDIRVYAFPNFGVWYDFGFLLGLGMWAGGGVTATAS